MVPLTPSGRIPTDTLVTFYIHIKNMYGIPRFGLQNGFRIYSNDGADWNSITIDTVSLTGYSWDAMFDAGVNTTYINADGYGADTVGIGGVSFFGTGLPAYFDETAYAITIGPIDESMDGRTVCLDSCFFPPAGGWLWFDEYAVGSVPPWGGPYEYEIEKPNTTILYSGHLYYLDPVPYPPYYDTNSVPMRRIRVQMWDSDFLWDELIADTTADTTGYFNFGPIENSDLSGTLDIYFKIFAENEACYVTDDYNGDLFVIQTPEQENIPSGIYDTTIVAALSISGPFFIADAVLEAQDLWGNLAYYEADSVQVVLTDEDTTTAYNFTNDYIRIRNLEPESDTYNKDVLYHEYGHFLEDIFGFFDQGVAGEHDWGEWGLDPIVAATEAYPTFISCVFRDDPVYRMFDNDFLDTSWLNAENGCLGENSITVRSANNYGDSCEASVCGILWDIYDNEDDDYSTYQWPPDPPPNLYDPDGIWDTLRNGPYNILSLLLHRTVDGHYPDEIDEFWDVWFQSPTYGHVRAMNDIWYEHGIIKYLCGDANSDGLVDVGDALFLIAYIFKGGPAPNPLQWSNVNNYGSVDVGDAVYLITYIFKNGPEPNCP